MKCGGIGDRGKKNLVHLRGKEKTAFLLCPEPKGGVVPYQLRALFPFVGEREEFEQCGAARCMKNTAGKDILWWVPSEEEATRRWKEGVERTTVLFPCQRGEGKGDFAVGCRKKRDCSPRKTNWAGPGP